MAKLSEAHAEEIKESMKAAGINFVVYVPDSWSHLLQKKIIEDDAFFSVGMVREDEAMATAMGAFLGGKNSAIIMEASGLGLSGLALGWLAGMQRMALLIVSSHTAALGEYTDYHAVTRTVAFPMLVGAQHSVGNSRRYQPGPQDFQAGADDGQRAVHSGEHLVTAPYFVGG